MPLREGDDSKEFKEKLQNPPRPINDTSASPEMEEYLYDLNNGKLESEETKKKEAEEQKRMEEEKNQIPYCPTCRRADHLKRAPGGWSCGHCGLFSNSPLYMTKKE